MRRFEHVDHMQIEDWYRAREMKPVDPWYYPPTGYIVDGVAAGFLIRTDNEIGILDLFITNPQAQAETRSFALDAITQALIVSAQAVGIMIIKCDSQVKAIKERAERQGFKYIGDYSSYLKEISWEA